MTGERFWEIVADSRAGLEPSDEPDTVRDEQVERLRQLLSRMPVEEVQAFADYFAARMDEAYSRPREGLWAVAFDIAGGCSDDMFDDFRAWLISMGREVYEEAVRNPESVYVVAERAGIGEDVFFESFQYVPSQVLRTLTGEEE
jgi:hypothetical protein